MNRYARIFCQVARHPKFHEAGASASWLWLLGIIYCQEMETDGFISRSGLNVIGAPFFGTRKALMWRVHKLCDARLWVEYGINSDSVRHQVGIDSASTRHRLGTQTDSGWLVNDYLEYNSSAEQIRLFREQKRAAGAKGGAAKASKVPSTLLSKGLAIRTDPIRSEPYSEQKEQQASRESGGTPLVQPRRRGSAYEGPRALNVPQQLHADFIRLLNKPDAERELLTWYEAVATDWSEGAHRDSSPGGDMFAFWRDRFSEKWPRPNLRRNTTPEWARES